MFVRPRRQPIISRAHSSPLGTMRLLLLMAVACLSLAGAQSAGYADDYQDYGDYQDGYGQEDNLYADYAKSQELKATQGGGGWAKTLAFGAATWFIGGKIHSKRAVKKANQKFAKQQKEFYTQYYNDVYKLQTQNAELSQYIEQLSKQQLDGEFEAADVDNDNKVSRAEFQRYKNNYLAKHPEMASQFPRFEDFDPDMNGLISKAEYDAYYRKLGL